MMKIVKRILVMAGKSDDSCPFDDISNDCNAEIIRVNSANEVIKYTARHEFAAVIIDTPLLPGEICRVLASIRGSEKTKELPVIIISDSRSAPDLIEEENDTLMLDYIVKPVKSCILAGKIRTYLCLYEHKKNLEYEKEKSQMFKQALRQLETKSRKLKTKSEESDKLITSFFANLSHEIRTPMNAIIGFSNLLADDSLPAKDRLEFISYINRSSLELLNLIDNIIDISKIEAGQLNIKKEPVKVNEVLKELYHSFKAQLDKKEPGAIVLVYNNLNNREDIIIHNDECRLRQVMQNLLNNALKFTKKGLIEFGFGLSSEKKIIFYVKDTGIGIPEDKLQKIFNRFERVDNEYYTNIPGTGLGLFVVKKMVELMGGKIWVESELGEGSVFYLELEYKKSGADKRKSISQPGTHSVKTSPRI
jgi:signal transduction histidine kinase